MMQFVFGCTLVIYLTISQQTRVVYEMSMSRRWADDQRGTAELTIARGQQGHAKGFCKAYWEILCNNSYSCNIAKWKKKIMVKIIPTETEPKT